MKMERPYRVIVWGPGSLGAACIREICRRPEFELAGVLAYSPEKIGLDAGEYVGENAAGIKITGDKEQIFRTQADCVLHCVKMPIDAEAMHADVIRLLESGKNVISSAGYHFSHKHGTEHVSRLEAACRKGAVSLYGGGENPGFMMERLGLTMAAACGGIKRMRLQEFTDLEGVGSSPGDFDAVGFGRPVADVSTRNPGIEIWKNSFHGETLTYVSHALFGRPPDRIEQAMRCYPSKEDVEASGLLVRKGTVGYIEIVLTAWLNNRPVLASEIHWFTGKANSPLEFRGNDHWVLELEGEMASFRLNIDAFASLKGDLINRPGDDKAPIMYASAALLLHAIPVVCSASPGVLTPSIWHADRALRTT
jgi:4-hydroxy-tetrahydrodipicolinate reductase